MHRWGRRRTITALAGVAGISLAGCLIPSRDGQSTGIDPSMIDLTELIVTPVQPAGFRDVTRHVGPYQPGETLWVHAILEGTDLDGAVRSLDGRLVVSTMDGLVVESTSIGGIQSDTSRPDTPRQYLSGALELPEGLSTGRYVIEVELIDATDAVFATTSESIVLVDDATILARGPIALDLPNLFATQPNSTYPTDESDTRFTHPEAVWIDVPVQGLSAYETTDGRYAHYAWEYSVFNPFGDRVANRRTSTFDHVGEGELDEIALEFRIRPGAMSIPGRYELIVAIIDHVVDRPAQVRTGFNRE